MAASAAAAPDPRYLLGWAGALLGTLGFGSFAVPIKGAAATAVDVDPLVMQSYKSLLCFLTSWLVIALGQEVTFTWWGVVSGLFWVPGGTFNIFAIRNAGLAISQGIVSSSIVMVSFIWGNMVFQEPAKSQPVAYAAVWLIMAGLYGMSHFSAAEPMLTDGRDHTPSSDHEHEEEEEEGLLEGEATPPSQPLEIAAAPRRRPILICGKTYSRRNLGLVCALASGTWGGSCLVPMHYSKGDTSGLGYVISFSVGALLVTILAWILRYTQQLLKLRSPREAYKALPSFHFKVMWLPGATAGTLWSLGNVGSILAVQHLGQGVGYSASQAALLVRYESGIRVALVGFFLALTPPESLLSAIVTIAGILLLGYESAPEE